MEESKHIHLVAFWCSLTVVIVVLGFSAFAQSTKIDTVQSATGSRFGAIELHLNAMQEELDKLSDEELESLRRTVQRIESDELKQIRDDLDILKQRMTNGEQ